MEKYFKELNTTEWSGRTIILDIDGTITIDGGSDIDPLVLIKIHEIALLNSVLLYSNKPLPDRNKELAKKLHVSLLETSYKKPNKKVIYGLPINLRENIIVIGDKILTDGFFAKNINAEFIKVKRLTSKNDNFSVKTTYLLDDIIKQFIN
jgi:predicted HAD superfamily phosphohydrolase YqeG